MKLKAVMCIASFGWIVEAEQKVIHVNLIFTFNTIVFNMQIIIKNLRDSAKR